MSYTKKVDWHARQGRQISLGLVLEGMMMLDGFAGLGEHGRKKNWANRNEHIKYPLKKLQNYYYLLLSMGTGNRQV